MSITIPSSEVDLFDDAVLDDPYPLSSELRELGAAVWLERHRAWAIPRYSSRPSARHARYEA
jgi:hypothetical protein